MNEAIESVIQDLGQQLKFKNFKLNEQGRIHLIFKNAGDLYIEATEEGQLRISLKRQHAYPSHRKYLKALELCHFRQASQANRIYVVGMTSEDIFFFSTLVDQQDLMVPELMTIIKTLIRLQEMLSQSA